MINPIGSDSRHPLPSSCSRIQAMREDRPRLVHIIVQNGGASVAEIQQLAAVAGITLRQNGTIRQLIRQFRRLCVEQGIPHIAERPYPLVSTFSHAIRKTHAPQSSLAMRHEQWVRRFVKLHLQYSAKQIHQLARAAVARGEAPAVPAYAMVQRIRQEMLLPVPEISIGQASPKAVQSQHKERVEPPAVFDPDQFLNFDESGENAEKAS